MKSNENNSIAEELQQAYSELTTLKTKYGSLRIARNCSALASTLSIGCMLVPFSAMNHFSSLNVSGIDMPTIFSYGLMGIAAGMWLGSFVLLQGDVHILKKDIKNKEEEVNQKVLTLSNSQAHEIK